MSTSSAINEVSSLHRGEKANVGIKLAQMRTTRENEAQMQAQLFLENEPNIGQ